MTLLLRALLAVFLLAAPVLADDNPRLLGYPPNKIMGFLGIDNNSRAPLIADGRATDAQNVKLSSAFDLKQRFGYSVVNDTLDDLDFDSPAVTGLFDYRLSDGTNYPVVFLGNKIKYNSSGTWTEISNVATAPILTASQDNQFVCIQALNTVICSDDVASAVEINSTPVKSALDVSDLSDALTKVKALAWFRNYLILGNTVEAASEKPTRFRWSNVGTTETYTDADFIDIAEEGGDEIVALVELYGNLYAFFKQSIYRATLVGGDDVFNINKVISNIGTVAKNSVQVVRLPNNQLGVIFLDEDKKIYMFNGLAVTDIGRNIQSTLNSLSETRLQYAVSAYDGTDYYLSVTSSGGSSNDILLNYQVDIGEWTKHIQIDANAMASVKDSSLVKTYFGNYNAFVYWMDNPDNDDDVVGITGIVDSIETVNTSTGTGLQLVVTDDISSGALSELATGATMRITSGTGAGEERVVLTRLDTGIVVESAFSTTPDSTSNFSIGDISSFYYTKWYDFGNSARKKNFNMMYFWAAESSNTEVILSYAEDFGGILQSTTKDLSPSSSSLWGTGLWGTATWGTTGDKFFTSKLTGKGRSIQIRYSQSDIDKSFHIYGFHLLADALDTR